MAVHDDSCTVIVLSQVLHVDGTQSRRGGGPTRSVLELIKIERNLFLRVVVVKINYLGNSGRYSGATRPLRSLFADIYPVDQWTLALVCAGLAVVESSRLIKERRTATQAL
jgi:hypothetical protein